VELKEFRDRIKNTEVRCQLCAGTAHSLIRHIRESHSFTPSQYKERFPEARLVSPLVSEVLRRFSRQPKKTHQLEEVGPEFLPGLDSAWLSNITDLAEKTYGQVKKDLEILIPTIDPLYKMTEVGKSLAYAYLRGKNCYIEGPTGCGKSELVKQLMAVTKRPVKRVNMHGDVTASNFIGQMKVNVQGTYFDMGDLPRAMKSGYPLMCDEVDFTPPHIAATLHPVMEKQPYLSIPETGEVIRAEKGFMVIGIGNTGGKGDMRGAYTGTEVLNTAFLDRFPIKLQMDYLESDLEQKMLVARFPKIGREEIDLMVSFANEIRAAFKQGDLMLTFSTRKLVDYFEAQTVLGKTEALKVTVLNWLDHEDSALVDQIKGRVGL